MKKLQKRQSMIMDTVEAFICACECGGTCSIRGCGYDPELNAMNSTRYEHASSYVQSGMNF